MLQRSASNFAKNIFKCRVEVGQEMCIVSRGLLNKLRADDADEARIRSVRDGAGCQRLPSPRWPVKQDLDRTHARRFQHRRVSGSMCSLLCVFVCCQGEGHASQLRSFESSPPEGTPFGGSIPRVTNRSGCNSGVSTTSILNISSLQKWICKRA